MAAVTYHDAVQQAVISFVKGRRFPRVQNPSGLRETAAGPYDATNSEAAKTALCHRVGARYGENAFGSVLAGGKSCLSRPRSALMDERWQLILEFDREASLVEFEQAWAATPLTALTNPANLNSPKLLIDLLEMEQADPAEQQPSSGLRALYNLRVHWPTN